MVSFVPRRLLQEEPDCLDLFYSHSYSTSTDYNCPPTSWDPWQAFPVSDLQPVNVSVCNHFCAIIYLLFHDLFPSTWSTDQQRESTGTRAGDQCVTEAIMPWFFLMDKSVVTSSFSRAAPRGVELYLGAAAEKAMSYSTLWRPCIVVMKPMTNLCWLCQRNSTIISRSSTGLKKRRP